MRVPRETIEAIRERLSIVDVVGQVVTLKRKGSSMMGLCPFHQEKTPSFSVVPAKGIYHCFGCSEGGDIFAFVQKTRGLPFYDAVKDLAEQAGVTITERELTPEERRRIRARAGLHDICRMACEFFHSTLMTRPEARPALEYLKQRGVSEESIQTFRLGYAPEAWDALLNHLHQQGITAEQAVAAGLARWRESDNRRRGAYDLFRDRIITPIFDRSSRPIAFGGRILNARDNAPKYVNSPETDIYKKSKVLYGLSHAIQPIQRNNRMLVVEGYFDVIALHQAGFGETVATCGVALTEQHLRAIRPLTSTVITVFDTDQAGVKAAERSLPLFFSAGIEPKRLIVKGAKDPDEFIQHNGADAFDDLLVRCEPLYEVVLRQFAQRHGPSPNGRQQTVNDLAPMLRKLEGVSRAAHIERTANLLRVSERSVRDKVGQPAPSRRFQAQPARWEPDEKLRTLLWLMLHYPNEVAEELLAFPNPEWLTDNPEVLRAIGMMLKGCSLPEILEAVSDIDVARLLRVAATKDLGFNPNTARNETLRYLAHIQKEALKRELFESYQRFELARSEGQPIQEVVKRISTLQHQLEVLRSSKTWLSKDNPDDTLDDTPENTSKTDKTESHL